MEEFVHRGGIIKNGDYRGREYDRGSMRFCSVLACNLSGTSVRAEGNFAGNGWMACSFFGARYTGLVVEMEQYDRCSMSGIVLEQTCCRKIVVKGCGFAGSVFKEVRLYDSFFEGCSFRRAHFCKINIRNTVFSRCIFEYTEFCQAAASKTVFRECIFYGGMPELKEGYILQNCTFD